MKSQSAAPDVDLRSRGLSSYVAVAAIAIASGAYLFGRGGSEDGDGAEKQGEEEAEARWTQWLLWALLRLVQVVCGSAALLLGLLVVQQRKILYVPAPAGTQRSTKDNGHYLYRSPDAWGLPFEDVMIATSDGVRVNAWLIYQPSATVRPNAMPYTFVYFHGNAGNIGHRLENIKDMHAKLKVNVLIIDYRGYGDSEDGDGPSERGFMKDAAATYRWLVDRIKMPPSPEPVKMSLDRILIFGRSIGGAVGVRLMADLLRDSLTKEPEALPLPAGVVLENTFTSLRDMAVCIFPFLHFVRVLLRAPLIYDEWNSSEALEYLTKNHSDWCCCLLSGEQDHIVPPVQMRKLHDILKKNRPKVLKFFIFQTGGHNDTPIKGGAEYWASFAKFMSQVSDTEDARRQDTTRQP